MARRGKTKEGRKNAPGGFAGIPRAVMKHPDYFNLSPWAKVLLLEFACQFRGSNNGDLQCAYSLLVKRGFNSKGTIKKALDELIAANWVLRTREGRFINPGGVCALYALTWSSIDECGGKHDVKPTTTPPRKLSLEAIETPSPPDGPGSVHSADRKRTRNEKGKFKSVHPVDPLGDSPSPSGGHLTKLPRAQPANKDF